MTIKQSDGLQDSLCTNVSPLMLGIEINLYMFLE